MDAFALTPPHTTPVTAPVMLPVIAPALVQWQAQHGRNHLPWQATRDPYRVWLSEIMLQQTQVATVLGYYSRFLAALPDVAALAAASSDDVMALWSGLGYYSRARNLHRCAQAVMREHGGQFPRSAAVLATLPGIGRTTAAAIAAFCFEERSAILDANVKRVLTRVLAFEGDLAQAAQEKALWALAEQLLPEHGHDMPRYTQALMDLGATVCTPRQPACSQCPLQAVCQAHQAHAAERYPIKTRTLRRSSQAWWLLFLRDSAGRFWLQRRPEKGGANTIWAGLFSPLIYPDAPALEQALASLPTTLTSTVRIAQRRDLPVLAHVLTHRDLFLHPVVVQLEADAHALDVARDEGAWCSPAQALALGLPAPVRKLMLEF